MKSQGEIEASICEGMSHFEQEYMGRGPKDIRAYLIGDLLVVRLQGVLTAAEQQLVKTLHADKGRDLLKQLRTQLMETARPLLEAMIHQATGVKPLSLHHDISTVTGEEVVLFTLSESPLFRETKKRQSLKLYTHFNTADSRKKMEALEAGAHAFPSYPVMSGKVFIDFKAQPDFYAFDCEHRHFDQTIERIMAAQSGYMQR